MHLHARTHSLNKKKLARERTKSSGAEREGERGGVSIERRVPRQAAGAGSVAALSLLLSLSHWVYVWHLSGVGPAPSMLSSCVCLSNRRPLPLVGIDRERRGKRRGVGGVQGLTHQTKVGPIEAKAPNTLQIFTHTRTHSSFSPPLCPVPLTALDIREGWDVRERIHIQISMTVTKTDKEC